MIAFVDNMEVSAKCTHAVAMGDISSGNSFHPLETTSTGDCTVQAALGMDSRRLEGCSAVCFSIS